MSFERSECLKGFPLETMEPLEFESTCIYSKSSLWRLSSDSLLRFCKKVSTENKVQVNTGFLFATKKPKNKPYKFPGKLERKEC